MNQNQINYRKLPDGVETAFVIYRNSMPPNTTHAVDFVAGWNAAMAHVENKPMKWFSIQQFRFAQAGSNLDKVFVRAERAEGALGIALASLLTDKHIVEVNHPEIWHGACICRVLSGTSNATQLGWPPKAENLYEYWVVREESPSEVE